MLADADDTAKAALTLSFLGMPSNPDQMIAKFEAETHFLTYEMEKTKSFSANCNVLNALLHTSAPDEYLRPIIKATEFLCSSWSAGTVNDKWVCS